MDKRESTIVETQDGTVSPLLATDEFFLALAAQPRRRALAYLLTHEQCPLEELVDVLCGWEAATGETVPPERARQVRLALIHQHLPRLEKVGLVSYDKEREEVSVESRLRPVAELVWGTVRAESQ